MVPEHECFKLKAYLSVYYFFPDFFLGDILFSLQKKP